MRKNHRTLVAALALLPAVAAGQEPGGPVPVERDLMAVLKLRGKPCEAMTSYERLGESDYLVVCSDGHRYRIFIEEDRVELEDR